MTHGRCLLLVLFCTGWLIISGCTGDRALGAETITMSSTNPNLYIQVEINPDPAMALQENEVLVTLQHASGRVISDARVTISLSMAGMHHGNLEMEAEWKQGQYAAKVVPVMLGKWVADVKAEVNNDIMTVQYVFQAVR